MTKWNLYYHLVWTTKERLMLITPDMEETLFRRLALKCQELEGFALAINGMPDHVHLIVSIPPTVAISNFVGSLKGFSSRVISLDFKIPFQWQRGYGIFSISKRGLPYAIEYVENQKEHHRNGRIIYALEHTSDEEEGPETMPSNPN